MSVEDLRRNANTADFGMTYRYCSDSSMIVSFGNGEGIYWSCSGAPTGFIVASAKLEELPTEMAAGIIHMISKEENYIQDNINDVNVEYMTAQHYLRIRDRMAQRDFRCVSVFPFKKDGDIVWIFRQNGSHIWRSACTVKYKIDKKPPFPFSKTSITRIHILRMSDYNDGDICYYVGDIKYPVLASMIGTDFFVEADKRDTIKVLPEKQWIRLHKLSKNDKEGYR